MTVTLGCPLCGAVVSDGPEPEPGTCPECGAEYAGGGQTPPDAVRAALRLWGGDADPAEVLARRLFEVEPAAAPEPTAAITSDRREAFYLWWVFVRPGADGPAAVLAELAAG